MRLPTRCKCPVIYDHHQPLDDPEIPAGILVEVGDEFVRGDFPRILVVAGAGNDTCDFRIFINT